VRRCLAALAALTALVACAKPPTSLREPRAEQGTSTVTSNVLFSDYAGSSHCAECHADVSLRFEQSPMHRMTRAIERADVHAPFDGAQFHFKNDVATFRQLGGRKYVELRTATDGTRVFRLTEVIGGRYREDFAGIEVTGTTSQDRPKHSRPRRLIMPISWLIASGEWRYKGYSVQVPERPGLMAGPTWSRTCIFCHNTVPYLSLAFDDLGQPGHAPYQGSTPANLLPAERRLDYRVLDRPALRAALADELERLGASQAASGLSNELEPMLKTAIHETRRRFDREHLVELGIGCESCHGGSREHASDTSRLPSFVPKSRLFSVRTSAGELGRAEAINHACARCHSVLFSRYAHTWEGGARKKDARGSTINSGEARDFLLGSCSRKMACTACHDPHAEDDRATLRALATPAGNRVCVGCHASLASEVALRNHSHHDPRGLGGSCVGCHMPLKNIGLGLELTRYHRIGSPTDSERVLRDRPLECALCHPNESVESLVGAMEGWWRRRYDRSALSRLYGDDPSARVLEATLARGLPHEQTVAIYHLGRSGNTEHAGALVEQLANDLPLARYFAREALTTLFGERPALDMSLGAEDLANAGRAWLDARAKR
jgi:predicted CXXCH cytochrome family protein